MCSAGLNANLDEVIDQNAKFCEKKATHLFIHGRQSSIEDIAVCLANIDCVSHFFIGESHNGSPLIVECIRELADILTMIEIKR